LDYLETILEADMASKKRPALVAQSPMTRMTQEFGDALSESAEQTPLSLGDKETSSSQQYCTPEYFSGDFCTPEDQMQELRWSQKDKAAEAAVRPHPYHERCVCPKDDCLSLPILI
jgi:hypothetical protein